MNPEEYLPNLSEEATKISDLLHGLVFSDAIYYMKDEVFTTERLIANFSKYGDKYDIFYFSGHAKDGSLRFSDNFIGNSDRMADVINVNLKNLQLGFFNACETFELARKIVEGRARANSQNRLVLITCGCEINAFLAERFATLFFNHVGRPGTYYDAYKNASTLMSLVNDKLKFREFYDYEEMVTATPDFDYAFVDIQIGPKPAAPAPAAVSAAPASPPMSAAAGAMYMAPEPEAPPISPRRPEPRANQSIINPDKKTLDILSANYVKECTQTAMTSNVLDTKQLKILTEAIKGTQGLADGNESTGKVKQLWKEAAKLLPGVDSKNDFRSLIKVSGSSYNKALKQFFGKTDRQPTLSNMQPAAAEKL
jgi:hypothetical protein